MKSRNQYTGRSIVRESGAGESGIVKQKVQGIRPIFGQGPSVLNRKFVQIVASHRRHRTQPDEDATTPKTERPESAKGAAGRTIMCRLAI